MIDPMSSLVAVLEALAGADPVTGPGPNDPDFLQVLQAIASPQRGSCPPGSNLLETIAEAARTMPAGGKAVQGILAGIKKLVSQDWEGIRPGGEKEQQEDPQTAIEMVLAILSVTSPGLKPPIDVALGGGTKMVGIESAADLASGAGPRTAVEMAADPFTRHASETGPMATDMDSPVEPARHGPQLFGVVSPWRKPAGEASTGVPPNPPAPAVSASIEGLEATAPKNQSALLEHELATGVLPNPPEPGARASIEGIEIAAPRNQSALLEKVPSLVDAAPAANGRQRVEASIPASWPAQLVQGTFPDSAMTSRGAVSTQAPVHHQQSALSARAGDQSDLAGMEDMLKTGQVRAFMEKPGEAQPLQHRPAEAGLISGTATEEPFDGQPISRDGASKRAGMLETYPTLNAVQQASGPTNGSSQAVAPEGAGATLPGAPLVEQIARRAHILRAQGKAGLDIQLEPKDLGKVRVFVAMGSDGLHVRLEAESSDTRGMLQASLPQLRIALENQGLKVDRFDLAPGAGSSGFGSPQDQTSQPRMNGGQRPMPYFWEETAASEPDWAPGLQPSSSLVDYRV